MAICEQSSFKNILKMFLIPEQYTLLLCGVNKIKCHQIIRKYLIEIVQIKKSLNSHLNLFWKYTVYNIQYCYLLNFAESSSENKLIKRSKLSPPGNSCIEHSIKKNYSYLFTSLFHHFYSIFLSFQSSTMLKLFNSMYLMCCKPQYQLQMGMQDYGNHNHN